MSLEAVAPAVFWVAGLLKARRWSQPSQRPITVSLLLLAVALTFDEDAFASWFDRLVAVPNLSTLLAHLTALAGVHFLLRFLQQVSGANPDRVRGRVLLAVVLVATIVSFSIAAPAPERTDFTEHFGHLGSVKVFWLVTIGYFAVCLTSLLRLSIGTARRADRREVRHGFFAVGLGVVVGIAYSAAKIAEILGADIIALSVMDHALLVLGSLLIGGGVLYPVAAGAVESGRAGLRSRIRLVQLRPAWERAVTQSPSVVLGERPSLLDDLTARGVRNRLYRRVIEIRDAALDDPAFLTARDRTLVTASEPLVRAGQR